MSAASRNEHKMENAAWGTEQQIQKQAQEQQL